MQKLFKQSPKELFKRAELLYIKGKAIASAYPVLYTTVTVVSVFVILNLTTSKYSKDDIATLKLRQRQKDLEKIFATRSDLDQIRSADFFDNYDYIVKINPFSVYRLSHNQIPKQRTMQQMIEQGLAEEKANQNASATKN